jgi:hypothetical protein
MEKNKSYLNFRDVENIVPLSPPTMSTILPIMRNKNTGMPGWYSDGRNEKISILFIQIMEKEKVPSNIPIELTF